MTVTTKEIVMHLSQWALERASDESVDKDDAHSIVVEFYEWIEPEDDELEVISLDQI